jgi:hypothetical protein
MKRVVLALKSSDPKFVERGQVWSHSNHYVINKA